MDGSLKQISDGKLYNLNDMVKVGCHDCNGCSQCCCDMGQSILLDPMDAYGLEKNLGQTFEQLMAGPVELHVEDGLILPNLKMQKSVSAGVFRAAEKRNLISHCYFLNEQGRCSIHGFRPGICRLFPLGRNYDGDKLNYFLLTDVCPAKNKSKMKVSRWLDTDGIREYQQFLIRWHGFTKALRIKLQENASDEDWTRQMNMLFLQVFYVKTYEKEDFYSEFYARLEYMESLGKA